MSFLSILRPISYIFDPRRPGSLASICLSSDGHQVLHKIPFNLILNDDSISLIQHNRLAELPDLFHNLYADNKLQKQAFARNEILLNSWELLVMIILKQLAMLKSVDSFYQIEEDQHQFSQRLTDTRISNIILQKIISYFLLTKNESLVGHQFCDFLIQAADEYLLKPTIMDMQIRENMKIQASLRFRSPTSGDGCQLKTHQLDAIYMLIISYQDDFKSVSDLNEKMRSMQMNSSQSKQRNIQTQI